MKKTALYFIASFILNLTLSLSARAQTNSPYASATYLGNGQTMVTISPSRSQFNCSYLVASNQIVTLNTFNGVSGSQLYVYFANGTYFESIGSGGIQITKGSELQFTGATNVNFSGPVSNAGGAGVATFTVCTQSTNYLACLPVNSVVIPSDATGPVQIILESSSDLINWVPSLPGTYGSTYTNRFFRVRAVAQ